jgi:hypothetical protein
LLVDILVWPDSDGDYADVYNGRDATAGKKFARFECATSNTRHYRFGFGIPFDVGIFIDAKDSAVETTVAFVPL